jgi:hypothetical protein
MAAFTIELNVTGIDGVLATLQSLPAEVVSKRGGPVKAALRKGALVILNEEKVRLRAAVTNATASGKRESTGLLLGSLIASRGKAPTDGKGERYLVRVKRKQYTQRPDGTARGGKAITNTLANAQRLEYGTATEPADPFIRPAFLSKAEQAIITIQTELVAGVDRVVNKLAAQNRGK